MRPRSFEGNGFQRAVLGLSGYDRFGNRTGWGRFKEAALPIVYGVTGAVGAAALGINPATGAKLGSAWGSGLNKLSNLGGQNLLAGTDGEQVANDAAVTSAAKGDFFGGLVNTAASAVGGAMDVKAEQSAIDTMLANKIDKTNPIEYSKATEALRLKKQQYLQGLSESGIQTLQSMAAWQSSPRSLNAPMGTTRFMQFRTGGVPTTVLETAQLSPSSLVGFEAADLAPTSEATPMIAEEAPARSLPVLNRIANAERSGYNAVNHVGPGHYGKYQFEPMLIRKYAGVSEQEFLKSPKLQEEAMQRRLFDLQQEAAKVKATTGSGLSLDDIMVGVHFKGMGQMKKELLRPGLLYRATDKNPSTANYIFNRSYGHFKNGGSVMRSFAVGGTTVDVKADVGYTHYGSDDTTEDYFMVDKSTAKNAGLEKVLEKLSFGDARYGERIFDQDSNLLMSSVFQSSLPKEQKVKLLGEHVLAEMGTHDNSFIRNAGVLQRFQKGGTPNDPRLLFDERKDAYLKRINQALENLTAFEDGPIKQGQPSDVDVNKYKEFLLNQKEQLQKLEYGQQVGVSYGVRGNSSYRSVGVDDLKKIFDSTEPIITGKFIRDQNKTQGYNNQSLDLVRMGGQAVRKFVPAPVKPMTWDEFTGKPAQPKVAATNSSGNQFADKNRQTLDKQKAAQQEIKNSIFGLNVGLPASQAPQQPVADNISWYFPNVSGDMDTYDAQARILKANNALGLKMPSQYRIDGQWGDLTNQAYNNALRGYKNRYLAQGKTPAEAERMALVDLGVAPKIGRDASGNVGVVALNDPSRINTIQVGTLNGSRFDPKTGQQTLAPMGINEAKPVIPAPTQPAPSASNFNAWQGLASYLPDVARIGTGLLMNRANQPKGFELGAEYQKMKADLENRSNQGLTSQQRSMYQNQLTQGYAQGVGTLRNLVGGGANQAAVIAGLGRLSAGYNQGVGTMDALDAQVQANNRLRYQGAVMNDLTLRNNLFMREEQQKALNRQAAGQLVAASLQNMNDRNDFNGFYGPDSLYAQLQKSMIDKTNAEAQAANDIAAGYVRRLGPVTKPQ